MKKLLLSLGTVAAIAAPVASVIACGHTAAPKAKTEIQKLTDGKEIAISLTDGTKINGKMSQTNIVQLIKKGEYLGKAKIEKAPKIDPGEVYYFKLSDADATKLRTQITVEPKNLVSALTAFGIDETTEEFKNSVFFIRTYDKINTEKNSQGIASQPHSAAIGAFDKGHTEFQAFGDLK